MIQFNRKLKKRFDFEANESIDIKIEDQIKIHFAFEVSSEGELEQVYAIVEALLMKSEKIEILYCSESVSKACLNLQKKYPGQINLLSLPVLSYFPLIKLRNPIAWIQAKHLIFCRYDFFPELMGFSRGEGKKMSLVSGSMKNHAQKNRIQKLYLKSCYDSFDKIISATQADRDLFSQHFNSDVREYDFRIPRIMARLDQAGTALDKGFPSFSQFYEEIIKAFQYKIILGSYWDNEVEIVHKLLSVDSASTLICLAPHKIDDQTVLQIVSNLNIPTYIINIDTTEDQLSELIQEFIKNGGVCIFQVKGILCELYSLFDKAYVGGGFGESVHSLLEPYLAGCDLYCGPKVYRSSEYDWIREQLQHDFYLSSMDDISQQILNSVQNSIEKNSDSKNTLNSIKDFHQQTSVMIDWLMS